MADQSEKQESVYMISPEETGITTRRSPEIPVTVKTTV